MKCKVIRNVDALSLSKVPNYMTVTIVTTIVRGAGAIERTIHKLREIVNGITTNIDDNIYAFRYIQFVCSFRKVEDKNIILSIKSSRSLSFNFQPSAATLLIQDRIGICLCKTVCAVRTGNHRCFSLTKVKRNTFNDMIRIRTKSVCGTVNVRHRRNFKITTESIEGFKIQLTCYNKLRQYAFTRSCITCRKGEVTKLCISADCKSTGGMMTLASANLKVAEAIECIIKWVFWI
jgi:hypothetical protein